MASSAPARARITHSSGAAEPNGDSNAQAATGSGLKAGPSAVSSAPPATSRPHSSHAHAS